LNRRSHHVQRPSRREPSSCVCDALTRHDIGSDNVVTRAARPESWRNPLVEVEGFTAAGGPGRASPGAELTTLSGTVGAARGSSGPGLTTLSGARPASAGMAGGTSARSPRRSSNPGVPMPPWPSPCRMGTPCFTSGGTSARSPRHSGHVDRRGNLGPVPPRQINHLVKDPARIPQALDTSGWGDFGPVPPHLHHSSQPSAHASTGKATNAQHRQPSTNQPDQPILRWGDRRPVPPCLLITGPSLP
jgi:hypothetical protein